MSESGLVAVLGAAVLVALLALTGRPMPIGEVASGSMEPTLAAGDRFLALPPWLIGGVEVGDIVVFETGGRFMTHRIVDRTDAGFLSAGDANPFLDQSRGLAPLQKDDIVGIVPTVADTPVALPASIIPDIGFDRRWLLGLGVAVVFAMVATREVSSLPAPRWIAVSVLIVVVLGALLVSTTVPRGVSGSIVNQAPIPRTLVLDRATGPTVTTLWPGDGIQVASSERARLVLGWMPPALGRIVALAGEPALALGVGVTTGGAIATTLTAGLTLRSGWRGR